VKQPAPTGRLVTGAQCFFDSVCVAFDTAANRSGHLQHQIEIGECRARLCFAGDGLIRAVVPALKHLTSQQPFVDGLTVLIWDSATTAVPMPRPPWNWSTRRARGELPDYDDGTIRVAFHPEPGIFSMFHVERNLAVYWIRDARDVPYYEAAAPLRTILHWWMSTHDRQLVHAAAVGTADAGALIVGRGGSGKSTTALACIASGLAYASDDFCLVGAAPSPCVWSVYNTGKLDAAGLQRIPALVPLVHNAPFLESEKAVIYFHEHYPERIASVLPIRTILLPRITGLRDTTSAPVGPAEALKALAPSTLFLLAGAGRSSLRIMAGIVNRVPCYRLDLGTDLSQVPRIITSLIRPS
jgi:hypothetical protein